MESSQQLTQSNISTPQGQEAITPSNIGEFDIYTVIDQLLNKDLETRKFDMYSFYHDVVGFLFAKIDQRPEIMRQFIHAINQMVDAVIVQTKESMNAQINELYMMADIESQEEVKGEESKTTPGTDPGLAMSMCDVSDEFIRTLASQCLGNKLRGRCKDYFKYFESLIQDDYVEILKMLDREFIDFKQDFQNEITSHETAQKAQQRIDLVQSQVKDDKMRELKNIVNNSLTSLHKDIIVDDMFNREIIFFDKFQEIQKLVSLKANILHEKLQKAIIQRSSAIMRSEQALIQKQVTDIADQIVSNLQKEGQVDIEALQVILTHLLVTNLPSSHQRFEKLKQFISNVLDHVQDFTQKFSLNEQMDKDYKNFSQLSISEVKKLQEQHTMNLLGRLSISQIKEQILFIALTGTNVIRRDCTEFIIRRIDSFHRDFLIKMTNGTLERHLREISQSDIIIKPLQFVTAIEEYIRQKQAVVLSTIQDANLVQSIDKFKLLSGIDGLEINISQFLTQTLIPSHNLKEFFQTKINYQFQDNAEQMRKQLEILDKTFDMIRSLDDKIGSKNFLPCLFKSLNTQKNAPVTKHVLLTFSGFLSQNDKSEDGWSHLHELMEPQGVQVFDLKWQSIQYSDIGIGIGKNLGYWIATEAAGLLIPGGKVLRGAKLLLYLMRTKSILWDAVGSQVGELFKKAIKNARITGKLVALSLALGYPFSTQSVSLLGFSLGTQVIKSCMKTLAKLGASDIVHNVTLLGGASHYESQKEWWEIALSETVGGSLKNVHSEGDHILLMYHGSQHHQGIGRIPYWTDSQHNSHYITEKDERKAVSDKFEPRFTWANFEVSKSHGHMEYRSKLIDIAAKINLEQQ